MAAAAKGSRKSSARMADNAETILSIHLKKGFIRDPRSNRSYLPARAIGAAVRRRKFMRKRYGSGAIPNRHILFSCPLMSSSLACHVESKGRPVSLLVSLLGF